MMWRKTTMFNNDSTQWCLTYDYKVQQAKTQILELAQRYLESNDIDDVMVSLNNIKSIKKQSERSWNTTSTWA